MSDQQIIEGCARHNRKAQQVLYDRYSRLLLGVCLRYASDKAEAEDILQDVEEGLGRVRDIVSDLRTFTFPNAAPTDEVRLSDAVGMVQLAPRDNAFLRGPAAAGQVPLKAIPAWVSPAPSAASLPASTTASAASRAASVET